MTSSIVIGAIALDRAMIWRNGIEPKTDPELVKAVVDNAEYRKERDREMGNRDRSIMDDDFLRELVPYFEGVEHFILISAGTGKSNAGQAFMDYLTDKQPGLAKKLVGLVTADVNGSTEHELLKIGRERWESFKETGI
ncbi:unannotated protein [freshwater metagenome]|uniref:Unannotated protein n=1 Tax=freshwater metagenome TaxID=449393 RepID=A0A6J6F9S6_9ZZZZ